MKRMFVASFALSWILSNVARADDTPAAGEEAPPETTPEPTPEPTPKPVAVVPHTSAPVVSKQTSVGVKLGMDWSWLAGDDIPDSQTTAGVGFAVGGFLVHRLNHMWALQPELFYAEKGTDTVGGGTISLDYISVPLLVRVLLPVNEGGSLRPYVFGGPEVALNVIAKLKGGGMTTDVKDQTAIFELSLNFGGGVEYTTSKQQILTFELRYGMGLTTVDKGTMGASANDAENNVVTFHFGWGF